MELLSQLQQISNFFGKTANNNNVYRIVFLFKSLIFGDFLDRGLAKGFNVSLLNALMLLVMHLFYSVHVAARGYMHEVVVDYNLELIIDGILPGDISSFCLMV